jgi:hypothetical protein
MEDDEKNENLETEPPRQPITGIFNARIILQSFWFRCRTIFPNITDRKFMESELRVVWYCGIIFWTVYLLSKVI